MPRFAQRTLGLLTPLLRALELANVSRWVTFAALIGFCAGLAAVGFRWMIAFGSEWMIRRPAGIVGESAMGVGDRWWVFVLIPAAGGLVTGWLTQTFAPEAEGHGTDSVIRAFHRLRGQVRKRVIALKALTSAITIGTGGSAGQEGPVAQVGAGVGSTLATALKLSNRDRRIFLLSGASAGIGAMFCSPLGGALFMPEVLYRKPEFEGDAIIPCIIASIVSYTTFTTLAGAHQAIHIEPEVLGRLGFDDPRQLIAYLFLAVVCTAVGWLYVRTFYGVHTLTNKLKAVPKFLRPALGGLLLGLLALALVGVSGEHGVLFGGYGLMHTAIESHVAVPVLLTLALAKIVATSFSISSGGSGGVFAPSLAIGALVGAAVGQGAHQLFPGWNIDPASFALVGMGGFFAGVAKVPIASVIMVCEMTNGYALLAPLMLVSVVSMMLSTHWSLYEAQVSGLVNSPAHKGDYVIDVLSEMRVSDILELAREPHLIHQYTTLRRVNQVVADAKATYFPVVDGDDHLVGIFSLTDLRRIALENVVEDMVIVRDFMIERVITASSGENLSDVLHKMTRFNLNAIPIVDSKEDPKVLGLLHRNEIGAAYENRLRALKESD